MWTSARRGRLARGTLFAERAGVAHPVDSTAAPAGAACDLPLNPRYTFERFVVGASNDLAAGSAAAVAAAPGRVYNPLFVYGATGLGKTHLMHAIAHGVIAARPLVRVCYTTAEAFRNDVLDATRRGALARLHARYASADLLLMDDLHTLRAQGEEQEEFVRLFTAFQDSGRQVVMTSDRSLATTGVEASLARRFRWGKIADLSLPAYEHRLAILRDKVMAGENGGAVPDAVLELVAAEVRTSVRALEGALTRLQALAALRHQPVTLDGARDALHLTGSAAGATTPVRLVQETVALEWGTTPEALVSPRRARAVVEPRQIAMLLCREVLAMPLADIGAAFGGRDHTTVRYSVERAQAASAISAAVRSRVDRVRQQLIEVRRSVLA